MAIYNWQQPDWLQFRFSLDNCENELQRISEKTGRVSGLLEGLPVADQEDLLVDMMLAEAIKTSAIEGEYPNRNDVLSSIRKNLGLVTGPEFIKDRSADGLGELMIKVRRSFAEKLTEETIFDWHRLLFAGNRRITAGEWRRHEEPMQVVSGAIGKEKVHFEAPPSNQVPDAMKKFIEWFNITAPGAEQVIVYAPVRAAIVHLYFETIHPFEDGNGRIGRALAEKALSQTIGRPVLLSLSRTIEADKKRYYSALENAQRSNEITDWIHYFVQTTLAAQTDAEVQVEFTLKKTKFFATYLAQLNERQLTVIRRMFEEGPKGFEGGMNARKYIGITKTSKATATRDMQQLLEIGAFVQSGNAGGRSTSYRLSGVW